MAETERVVRGGPQFVAGADRLTLVPEVALRADRTGARPTAVIAIQPSGVRRVAVPPPRDRWLRPLGLLAALLPVIALLRGGLRRSRR